MTTHPSVGTNGTGISGGFTSTVGAPASLAAAAGACGENQFNWYQIVTATNGAYVDRQGNALAPPFVDPPLNGLAANIDPTWADNLPWYWDQYAPPAGTPNFDASLQLSSQTTMATLNYADFPAGPAGRTISFDTWLVSLNANGSFNAFDGGFSWDWSNAGVANIAALAANPTAAQYQNIIAGFATSVPEPSSLLLVGMSCILLMWSRLRSRA